MNALLAAVLLASLALPFTTSAQTNAAPNLSAPVNIQLDNILIDEAIGLVAPLANLEAAIDPATYAGRSAPRVTLSSSTTEARYVLAWLLHLSAAAATIEGNKLKIGPAASTSAAASVFDCWQETNGTWSASVDEALAGVVVIQLDDVSPDDALRMATRISGLPLLYVAPTSAVTSSVTMHLEAQPARKMFDALADAGFDYRVQGGLVFVDRAPSAKP